MTYLEKVISGGQIGVDIAALRAAKAAGIPTGGYAPLNFRTKVGPNPELGTVYGLQALRTAKYPPRTHANVHAADCTLMLATDFQSPGMRCTLKAIKVIQKPAVGVVIKARENEWVFSHSSEYIAEMLIMHSIKTLNVVGNSDPELEPIVEQWLHTLFTYVPNNNEVKNEIFSDKDGLHKAEQPL